MTQSNDIKTNQDKDKNKAATPKQIEGEIGQTREAISDDIRALGDKLSPAALKAEAKDALVDAKDAAVDKAREVKDVAIDKAREVRDVAVEKAKDVRDVTAHAISETAHEVSEKVEEVGLAARRAGDASWHFMRDNAVPLSIIGLGAGLLLANNLPRRRPERQYRLADTYTPYGRTATYEEYSVYGDDYPPYDDRPVTGSRAGQRRDGGPSRTQRVGVRAQGAIQHAGERAQHAMHDAADRVQHRASQAKDRAVETFQTATRASTELVQEHPFAVGAALIALGIGVGSLLPSPQRQNRLPGRPRDRFAGETRARLQSGGPIPRETAKPAL